MSDWVREQFEKMGFTKFHRGGVVEGSGLRDGEVPAILSQGSPFVAPDTPWPEDLSGLDSASRMHRKDGASPVTVNVTVPGEHEIDKRLRAKNQVAAVLGRDLTQSECIQLDQAMSPPVTAEELRAVMEATPGWAQPEKTAAQKLVDDWRRGPGRSVAETYQASFHPAKFGKTHRHTLRAMAAQGRANGFGGVTIVPVPAGTEIKKDGQVEVVTATQAVHDENVVYVTPEHYEKLKAETEGPSDARR